MPAGRNFWLRRDMGLVLASLGLAALTAALAPSVDGALLPVALAYLLVALLAAAIWGWVVGVSAALASNLIFNFFFVEPLHRIAVRRSEDVVGLAMFMAVAAIGAGMLSLLKRQLHSAKAARAESDALLAVSRDIAQGVNPRDALERICVSISRALGVTSCSVLQTGPNRVVLASSSGLSSVSRDEWNLAQQAVHTSETIVYNPVNVRGPVPDGGRPERTVSFLPVTEGPGAASVLRLVGSLRAPQSASLARLLEAFKEDVSVGVHRLLLDQETRAFAELKRVDVLKSAVLSSLSHDLRTPLTSIKAALDALQQPGGDRLLDREILLNSIADETDRLSKTVDGLLEMSRLESGVVKPRLESIDAELLLEEVLEARLPAVVGRKVDLIVRKPVWVRADYRLVFLALTNILENAARHSTAGGPIELGALTNDGCAEIWVSDSGPGIEPDELPRIFEKFYVGKNSKQRSSGLGLAIARAMVEVTGGSVVAETSGGGTRFVICLPSAPVPA